MLVIFEVLVIGINCDRGGGTNEKMTPMVQTPHESEKFTVMDVVVTLCVTILPRTPQKSPQNNDTTKAADLKRRTRDIARDSHRIEDEIRAMVSSYMVPKDDEDQELAIGQLVC